MTPVYNKGELVEIVSEIVAPGTVGIIVARQEYPCDPMWFSYEVVADKVRRALGYQLRRTKAPAVDEKQLRGAAARHEVAEPASAKGQVERDRCRTALPAGILGR
jgi:hypothetical protein